MRVALFTDTYADINGVARFLRDAASWASCTGHDLVLITSTPLQLPDGTPPEIVINITPWGSIALPGYPDLRLVPPPFARAKALLRELRPDVVHVSTPGPVGIAGRRAALALGLPLVGTYHTDFPAYVSRLFDDEALTALTIRATCWFYGPFSKILTRSADYARRLKDLGFHCSRLRRLLPGTDTARFNPIYRTRPPGAQPLRLLTISRISVEKNLPFLSRVWAKVAAELGDGAGRGGEGAGSGTGGGVELRIVGGGPHLEAMRRQHGADRRVSFAGFRHGDDLSAEYADGDLFLFPSETDTLGQAVMEAQASGVPVIVSDQGGPREVVRDGLTGRVLPCREAAWAAAILALASDPARRSAMGRAATAHMARHLIASSLAAFWNEHAQVLAAGHREPRHCGPVLDSPDTMT